MPRPIVRVLVLDPSPERRARLLQLLQDDPSLQVVDAVGSADAAMEAAVRKQAQVILLGQGDSPAETVASTRRIMQGRATPLVVVTAATSPVVEQQAFALMEAGALAVLRDPGPAGAAQHRQAADSLRETLRLMSEVKVVRRWASTAATLGPSAPVPPGRPTGPARRPSPGQRSGSRRIELVAIGASTGGPVALKALLCRLPASFPVPIVIVQHMADGFLHGLADWLSASCAVPTQVAGPGAVLQAGHAYLAPDGQHMRVQRQLQLAFDDAPAMNGHRPAVACLLSSVATHYGAHAIGILLTGMGKDGAAELKQMKDAGAITIAQDEASSVVHGMPGEAIRCGGATYVMTPEDIGAALPALTLR
jgi:two-component system chemotaxis response regulator CheB